MSKGWHVGRSGRWRIHSVVEGHVDFDGVAEKSAVEEDMAEVGVDGVVGVVGPDDGEFGVVRRRSSNLGSTDRSLCGGAFGASNRTRVGATRCTLFVAV
ncbi:unnamed protein product [Calypogeia fissa]